MHATLDQHQGRHCIATAMMIQGCEVGVHVLLGDTPDYCVLLAVVSTGQIVLLCTLTDQL